jgi:hypothetical protein
MVQQQTGTSAQQKDNLCGSFCTARVLNDLGFTSWEGKPLDEDLVALRAGATLPDPELAPLLPPGAVSKTGYAFELPIGPYEAVGTSPAALVRVIESATHGQLRAIPVRGDWTAHRVERFIERATASGARLIANVHTGRLWGSHPLAELLVAELIGKERVGPPADWNVAHFVELTMLIRGPKGALVVVHDTYPTLGSGGYHLQPSRVVASALTRDDGREGGIVAVVRANQAGAIEGMARELGLEVAAWDNGCRS